MALSFLSTKQFHPLRKENQKQVFIAEQKALAKKRRDEEALRAYEEEKAYRRNQELMQYHTGKITKEDPKQKELGFMYKPPPGWKDDLGKKGKEDKKKAEEARKQQEKEDALMPEWMKHAPTEGV